MLKFSKTNVCNCTLFNIYRLLCIIQQNYRLLESELNHSLGTYMTLGYCSCKKCVFHKLCLLLRSQSPTSSKVNLCHELAGALIKNFLKGSSPKVLGNLIQKRRHEFFTLLIWVNVRICSFNEMFH